MRAVAALHWDFFPLPSIAWGQFPASIAEMKIMLDLCFYESSAPPLPAQPNPPPPPIIFSPSLLPLPRCCWRIIRLWAPPSRKTKIIGKGGGCLGKGGGAGGIESERASGVSASQASSKILKHLLTAALARRVGLSWLTERAGAEHGVGE